MIPVDAIKEFIRTTLEGEEGVIMKQMKTLVSDNFLMSKISKKMQEEWSEEI
jgi:hypothetical protein